MLATHQSVIVDPTSWYNRDDDDTRSSVSSSSQESTVEPGEDILATAMLKEEIRCNIMQKRIHKGLGNVNVEWKTSTPETVSAEYI